MNFIFAKTLRKYNLKNLPFDILAGIIVAAVSIPISMGYAQIAGLPAVYGLYGSIFPILFFSLFSTSPQFIFGVDAAPAALVGASLISMGIDFYSKEALSTVPAITFFTASWLLIFYAFKAGKLVNYISVPVMGGFISGICCTIILMQIPKLIGGTAGSGELFELIKHLVKCTPYTNIPFLILGTSTLFILLLSKRLFKGFPTAVLVMIAGAVLTCVFHIDRYGIVLLSHVEPGMPTFRLPDLSVSSVADIAGVSLSVAIVIMSETLLASNNFALKNNYKLDDNQELLSYSIGNFAAAFTGCCPINGSVSRSAMAEQYGGKTQLMSIVAGLSMIPVLLFGTDCISRLPVPVLTAIVISALIGATEFDIAKKLWRVSRNEFYIFLGVFMGVLILGTISGVLIGIVLSFSSVVLRSADPPRCFLGIIPGHDEEFFDMAQFKHTYPIEKVVIYRFNSNLFFANIGSFQNDIENTIKNDTIAVIIDAAGINSIDITAAERLEILYISLKEKGIKFYLTEHISGLNSQLRALGLGYMISEGAVRRTIPAALSDIGIAKPYPIGIHNSYHNFKRKRAESSIHEFIWAFGEDADTEMEHRIQLQLSNLKETGDFNTLLHGTWSMMDISDQDEWLDHLETHLTEIANFSGEKESVILKKFEFRRKRLVEQIAKEQPDMLQKFIEHRENLDEKLRKERPELYELIVKSRIE